MKKRHDAEAVIRILREVEGSPNIRDAIKAQNISEATYYKWRRRYGAMSVDEAREMKELQKENAQLKKVVAEQVLMIDGLRTLNARKW